jgi:hypothetical protein
LGLVPVEVTMSHKQTTYTVVAAFAERSEWKCSAGSVRATADWASEWWKHEAADHPLYENVGFTVHESHGGGAGWPVERAPSITPPASCASRRR